MDNETQESISLPENNVDKVNPVEYSSHLKLNPKLFPLSNPELHVLYQAGTDKTPSILGFYITEQKDRKTTYVGHTVFNINKPFPDTAALSINYGKTASFNRGLEDSKGISDAGGDLCRSILPEGGGAAGRSSACHELLGIIR